MNLRSRTALHWRDLLLELVGRDLKIRYQRSAIGLGWSLMKPLSQLLVFATVFSKVLPLNIENYTTFVFTGVLAWSWFSTSLTSSTIAVTANRELVRRPGFPVFLLPVLTIVSQGVHFLLALPLLLICAVVQTGLPGPAIVSLPLVIVMQFLLTLGVCYLAAAAHVYFRDVEHLVGICVMLGFYVTPVFYRPIQADHTFAFLTTLNPFAWLLECYRSIFLGHAFPDAITLAKLLVVSVPLVAIGAWVFRHVSYRFVDEL
ncbi:ABC transporter permease [Novosphingobium mangrovi (ex Huang et al. 2023)]|uniref:Transport permease protein n=1 Tax=Novosphingobium mangrovi (ex Huang et al. 2023) TaxID=2976432 RepID=A0ABT2I0R0_9SPHN|nr:ABC transporter permease [Novosphingobium mangrovi (ex Huang et al. 2023)]MCT2398392.1 ABC transporter permease [Novosphingobium mangrovi (ex Huang et al. 2023)]